MINRDVMLGETVNASVGFFSDNGSVIQPSDNMMYPSYIVLDFNGEFVTGGVGTFNISNNLYQCTFTMPDDAELSDSKYTIKWFMHSITNQSYTSSEMFSVVHPSFNETNNKEIQLVGIRNKELHVNAPMLYQGATTLNLYSGETLVATYNATESGHYYDYYIYSAVIPENVLSNTEYILVWINSISDTTYYQKLNVMDLRYMSKVADLRMYLDKVHKDMDLYVGYRDSDLYFHILRGLSIVNSITPVTGWTIDQIRLGGTLETAIFGLDAASMWSCLQSQYLAEGDSAFDYSGQPVSLTVDRTQFIESQISRLWDYLQGEFKLYKKQVVASTYGFHLGLSFPSVSNAQFGMNQQYKGVPFKQIITRM